MAEPIKPGLYVGTEAGWRVEVIGTAFRASRNERIVLYLGDGALGTLWDTEPVFRRYFTRLPDAPEADPYAAHNAEVDRMQDALDHWLGTQPTEESVEHLEDVTEAFAAGWRAGREPAAPAAQEPSGD